jgi:hypothetical protein
MPAERQEDISLIGQNFYPTIIGINGRKYLDEESS